MRPTLTLAAALFFTVLVAGSAVAQEPVVPKVRLQQTWTVTSAPAGPWDVYMMGVRLPSGYWAGPHTHPGPEFGMTMSGEERRWNAGDLTTVAPGGPFTSPPGLIHEGGNTSSDETVQLTTHLIPAGGAFAVPASPPPAGAPAGALVTTPIYRYVAPVVTHPPTPFMLTMQVVDFPKGMRDLPYSDPGLLIVAVMSGTLNVTGNGTTSSYGAKQGFTLAPGTNVTVASGGEAATVVITRIAPA